MTALPQPLGHLLTVAEYAEFGETESSYTELLEGRLLMSPSPVPDHNFAGLALAIQLSPQLPDHLEVIPDVDVWIMDLDEPVSLLDCHLADGFGYQDGGNIIGVFTTTEPFPVRLRLNQLL